MMALKIDDIDFDAVPTLAKGDDKVEALSLFLSGELEKAGGVATVEAGPDGIVAEWVLPPADQAPDPQQVAYVAHLMQAGLMVDPTQVLANTAYAGGIRMLSLNLLLINSSGRNKYVAERDACLLAYAAPLSLQALSIYGLILLENGKRDKAAEVLTCAQDIDPLDLLSCKFGAIACTCSAPALAVKMLERGFAILSGRGLSPDAHMRVSYGMALLAAGSKAEAGVQFMLACGVKSPAMTPMQWVSGGYRIREEDIPAAMAAKPKA